ncbi:hypothetical protein OK074_5557 [Actinobacteria bacterium OK074]|nr:hypothetical protein OK074_5557 [Actinobacteria bacterium OK074]
MLSPQAQSIGMWILVIVINVAGICAGIVWGWTAFASFLIPGIGSAVGAALVSYGARR